MRTLFPSHPLPSCMRAALAAVCLLLAAMAQAMQAPEPDLKAAIISNMLPFVDWPTAGGAGGAR